MRHAISLAVLALLSTGCLGGEDRCADPGFPAACDGYGAEFSVVGEMRSERGPLGVVLMDHALPERRYYVVGSLLTKLELSFPRSVVGRIDALAFGSRAGIVYDNGGRYRSNSACGPASIEIVGLTDSHLWGTFAADLCGPGVGGVPLHASGRFTARREDP